MDFFSLRCLKTSFQTPFKSMRFAFDLAAIPGRIKETLSFSEFPLDVIHHVFLQALLLEN